MRRLLVPLFVIALASSAFFLPQEHPSSLQLVSVTDSLRIEGYIQDQLDLGFRIPGSPGSYAFAEWIYAKIDQFPLYSIQNHTFVYNEVELRNFLITTSDNMPTYLIGAHYDSRARANNDPDLSKRDDPVPGANDAASGVAAILEMLHYIPSTIADKVGFILFDGEDQGNYGMINSTGKSWNWIVGSTQFVADLTTEEKESIESFILFDMIADDELVIRKERNSDTSLINEFWDIGAQLGYEDIFVDVPGYRITDDHVPFVNANISSLDLIDLDYPEWHTVEDDMDHISSENVAKVVDTTLYWVQQQTDSDFLTSMSNISSPIVIMTTSVKESSDSKSLASQGSPVSINWIMLTFASLIYVRVKNRSFFSHHW